MANTITSYQNILAKCQKLFLEKHQDYGTSWRIMRLPTITDQIYIKAKRIRTIQEKGTQAIADNIESEFIGIINYAIIALIQIEIITKPSIDLTNEAVKNLYEAQKNTNQELLANKNHDYGEAWRDMRISSMTDLILMKILRLKQIENNEGKTIASEGIDANYRDMLNYAVFCLIKLEENV